MLSVFSKNVLVPLLLRLTLATIFIFHGMHKVDPDNDWGAQWQKGADAPPTPVQLAVAWGELIGGIALILGLLTRLAALGIIALMVGAIATVHWPHGFGLQQGGFEYNFAIIMMCICLVLSGPGPLAIDRFFRFRRRET
jgi:putative oxidoreductase